MANWVAVAVGKRGRSETGRRRFQGFRAIAGSIMPHRCERVAGAPLHRTMIISGRSPETQQARAGRKPGFQRPRSVPARDLGDCFANCPVKGQFCDQAWISGSKVKPSKKRSARRIICPFSAGT
ncbi:MAG TPA: hypothetical protein VNQ78_03040, partial [Paracoccus sp. (in: a-proteobacteria)]|nr:hypothetical protein [Paracoccus sp. (in: a-proteobacteria)]